MQCRLRACTEDRIAVAKLQLSVPSAPQSAQPWVAVGWMQVSELQQQMATQSAELEHTSRELADYRSDHQVCPAALLVEVKVPSRSRLCDVNTASERSSVSAGAQYIW